MPDHDIRRLLRNLSAPMRPVWSQQLNHNIHNIATVSQVLWSGPIRTQTHTCTFTLMHTHRNNTKILLQVRSYLYLSFDCCWIKNKDLIWQEKDRQNIMIKCNNGSIQCIAFIQAVMQMVNWMVALQFMSCVLAAAVRIWHVLLSNASCRNRAQRWSVLTAALWQDTQGSSHCADKNQTHNGQVFKGLAMTV